MRGMSSWFLMGFLGIGAPALAQPSAPPNIVFVLADDLGWNDIGYHGSEVRTPNLDRLAAQGVRLDRHYVYPTCSPTRVALLAGRNPARFGVLSPLGATTRVRPGDLRLPVRLQALGYTTHITGKWHIGETPEHRPRLYGFTTSYGYLRGQIDPYTHRYKFGNHVTWHRNDEFVEECGHVTDLITEEAIRVIESASEKPFFLYVAHHAPHAPLNEPPQWIEAYEKSIEDPWRRHFAASITHFDHQVGRLVEALRRTGRLDNTLILFSSDNGGQEDWGAPADEYNGRYAPHTRLGDNRPLRGWKGTLYEGGIRVPAFAYWPGVLEGGRLLTAVTHVLDWAPTLLRLASGGKEKIEDLEGQDLWPLLSGAESSLPARSFYWNHAGRLWAFREADWKLILHPNGETELFDLASDPYEKTDLSLQHPEVKQRLLKRLREAQRDHAGPERP